MLARRLERRPGVAAAGKELLDSLFGVQGGDRSEARGLLTQFDTPTASKEDSLLDSTGKFEAESAGVTHAAKIRALKPKTGLTHDDQPMTAEQLVGLLEELIDLKTQQHAEMHLKATPEIARLLQEKRETDRRRLEQIRRELIAALET